MLDDKQLYPIIVALAASIPGVICALIAALIGWINREQIKNLHLQINSKMDRLLELTAASARAEGRLEGEELERQRKAPSS